jgi:hypothetical protein
VPEHRIFLSYSRKDAAIVTPLVQFLRLGGTGVFRDVDDIPPGVKWRTVLINAVDACELLVLFWCCHSAESAEVEKEYTQALRASKLLAPVLLDETPLTAALAEYQAIDLRGVLGVHDEKYVTTQQRIPGMLPGSDEVRTVRLLQVRVPARDALAEGARRLSEAVGRILIDGSRSV